MKDCTVEGLISVQARVSVLWVITVNDSRLSTHKLDQA